jgi:hypothetical protein
MAAYIRRFLSDPGNAVLTGIESINIIDLEPPSSISGIGSGTVTIVGEFEDGPYNVPLQVGSATDLANLYGVLGYNYGGVGANYPCAVIRKADGALAGETWNGNGFIQLSGKQFPRLLISRVDTSIGAVQFTPLAYITGASAFRYVLAAGQVLSLDVGSGVVSTGAVNATFTATAATITSAAQTFPTTFVGGEYVTLGYDNQPNFTVFFQAADQTQAQVIARINQFAGYAEAASVTGTTMSLTGIQQGSQAQIRVVAASAPGVLTTLGLVVGTTFGTGNVANILAVTAQEIQGVVSAAIPNTKVELDSNQALRVSNTLGTADSWISVGAATTATALGFVPGQKGTVLGIATVLGSGGVFPITSPTAGTITMLYDNGQSFSFTTANADTAANVITKINTAAGATIAYADGTQIRIVGKLPGGKIQFIGSTTGASLNAIGFAPGTTAGTPLPLGIIPAGTVVSDVSLSRVFVTTQSIQFTTGGILIGGPDMTHGGRIAPTLGPWTVRLRHAVDDGSGLVANAGVLTQLGSPVQLVSVSAINPTPTAAAMTESQIDAAYVSAFNATLDVNNIVKQTNIIYSARQSNVTRRTARSNALTASANGMFGRIACIRPPLGTTKFTATSINEEPGVGAYRDQRVIYCYPGARTFIQAIASRGVSGGVGFTPDGNIDVGADGWLASIMSQLAPEENPGQDTPFAASVSSVESSPNAQGFQETDYELFKASGICALRVDDGITSFQSGVTSVDPLTHEGLVPIARRRMADFIQDSLALLLKPFNKKLNSAARRQVCRSSVQGFMDALLNKTNANGQRIAGYSLSDKAGNTPDTLAAGIYRMELRVRTLSSMDFIVLQMTAGTNVQVTEVALPLAA